MNSKHSILVHHIFFLHLHTSIYLVLNNKFLCPWNYVEELVPIFFFPVEGATKSKMQLDERCTSLNFFQNLSML